MSDTSPNTCEITIDGILRVGTYPHIPTRFLIDRAHQTALGFTKEDREARTQREEGDPQIEPSESGDGFALGMVYAAAVGLCWPEPMKEVPTLHDCRHNVVTYGEGILDYFYRNHFNRGIVNQLHDEGLRLLREMVKAAVEDLVIEVQAEKGFTPAPEDPSISA